MALPLLALLGSLNLAAPAVQAATDAGFAAEDGDEDKLGLLNLKVKKGDKTLKHPGTVMNRGEEVVVTLKEGDRVHEVTVFVEPVESGFKFEAAYTINGVLAVSGEATGKSKQWVKIKSESGNAMVELQLDTEKKRRDGVDIPDGNNPLDGL